MRGTVILSIVLICWIQNGHSKVAHDINDRIESAPAIDSKLRNLSDVWNNIKNSANNAWKAIKNLAQNTKEKMNTWITNVNNSANDITKRVKTQIYDMKDRIKIIIEDIFETGHVVKQCIIKNDDQLEDILKHIIKHVTSCVSDNILHLSVLKDRKYMLELNDTIYIEKLEEKLYVCSGEKGNIEECADTIRDEMLRDMDDMEDNILRNRLESRNIADDLLDAIVSCSADGLLDASTSIAFELLEIIKCVWKSNVFLLSDALQRYPGLPSIS